MANTVDFTQYPDFQPEAQSLQRQRALIDALQAQSLQPLQPPESKGRVQPRMSILEPIAQVMQAAMARHGAQKLETQATDLGERQNQATMAAVRGYTQSKQGTPPVSPEDMAGDPGFGFTNTEGVKADPYGAVTQAMANRNPLVRQIAAQDYAHLKELDKPRVMNSDDNLVFPGGERPDVRGTPKHAIPPNWAASLPPGAKREATDPPGVFRMAGADGQSDVYQLEFEGGQLKGSKKLDNNYDPNRRGAQGANPFFTTISTPDGLISFDTRTNKWEYLVGPDGKRVMKAPDDPGNRGAVAAAAAAGKVEGRMTEEMRQKLPTVLERGQQHLNLIDKLVGSEDAKIKPHPGFSSYVGFTLRPGFRHIHGTKEAEFDNKLKEVTGGSFLQAYETLKGGGQITEIEGQKGTEALQRMQRATTEKDFVEAAREYQTILRIGMQRAREQAAASPRAPAAPQPGTTLRFDANGNPIP